MPVAHFVVEGAALTQMARDLMLSDEPGKAYRLIADNLVGEGAMQAALAILKGTHDLAGDSSVGIDLVPATPNPELDRYLSTVRYIYAGRYRDGQTWRRPVAYMVQFGSVDGRWASREVDGMIGNSLSEDGMRRARAFAKLRAKYYCGRGEEPIVLEVPDRGDGPGPGEAWVITQTCGELPHWQRPPNGPQEALDEVIAAGRPFPERLPEEAPRESKLVRVTKADRKREAQESELREAERKAELQRIADTVRERAGDDTFVMELNDGRKLTVPRAPFVRWALHRTDESDQAPPWDNVAPSGLKLMMDNPDHTDWMLGAGLNIDLDIDGDYRNDAVTEAAWDAAHRFQEEARAAKRPFAGIFAAIEHLNSLTHPAAVVVDAGERTGIVGSEILVLPDSDPGRVDELGDAVGVVVEKGGALAHFAIVTRGRGITVMRHLDACRLFTDGTQIKLDPKSGRVVILED